MEMDGVSSGSRRCGSGRNGECSSSSTQGFFVAKVENDRDGVAPKCHCHVYAILYLSKTAKNPNRLFFGCPFFKIKDNHCRFFLWLDRHLANFGKMEDFKAGEDAEDVNGHFAIMKLENRLDELEERVAAVEKKKRMHVFVIVLSIVVFLLSICVSKV
ncbi:hypothetical protein PIB30_000010 [Stylosanthes scabra]|uniref:GRF-type domain-containing protein n=1 Tax=Stylosanthes scabra TaxID=79078 RepID=A0ABU6Q2X2_9FABA|nr:hypothetical protein [Stylosanthes scabra]